MNGELLVRTYDVGFGDCIFVRIPDGDDAFHMLIDCGTCNSMQLLRRALADMRTLLPDEPTENRSTLQKRLDLLVVTHPHKDHICGLIPEWFSDIRIGQIWLSAFIKEDHPQARKSREVMELVDSVAREFLDSSGSLADDDVLREMLAVSLSNHDVLKALRGTAEMPNPNFPSYTQRLYVCREPEGPDGAAYREQLAARGLVLEGGSLCYRGFHEPTTTIRVLAPEWDIDGWYLGRETPETRTVLASVRHLQEHTSAPEIGQVRSAMMEPILRFIELDDDLRNDTSVVLLLEWRGRRLLFPGDAEWTGRPAQRGQRNGSWDVMLQRASSYLSQPLDFIKVAHHGSVNGTPFVDKDDAAQPTLDTILPVEPEEDRAFIVASTRSGVKSAKQHEVPYEGLMQELGRRARNARNHLGWQPERTDLDCESEGRPFLETVIAGTGFASSAPARSGDGTGGCSHE